MSPGLGMTTVFGSHRICCTCLKAFSNVGVQAMLSFSDLVAGISASSSSVAKASCVPSKHISWNLTPPRMDLSAVRDFGVTMSKWLKLVWIWS